MSKYDVDFKKLSLSLLPTMLRHSKMAAFCYCLVTPICSLHQRFMQYRKNTHYRLYHNGQVCYLQAVINDIFDPINRTITISDAQEQKPMLIYARTVGQWKFVKARNIQEPTIINQRGFDGSNSIDFVVNVPVAVTLTSDDEKRMRAVINQYKLAGKRYAIIKQ